MARKAMIEKQKRRQKLVNLKWGKRQELKKIIYDLSIPEEERMTAVDKLHDLSKNSSPVRLRNRCVRTGRCRGYLRKFKLSRLCFRETALNGLIPGVVKASW